MSGVRSDGVVALRSLPLSLKLFAAVWLMLALYWQWLAHADGIFGEMWDTLPAFQQLHGMTLQAMVEELLRKYAAVHILALPKLFFWLDFSAFGASGRFTRSCSFVVSLGCALLLWQMARRDFSRPVIGALLALVIFFNPLQAFVINWDFLLQHFLAILFALLAFAVYWRQPQHLLWPCLLLVLSAFSCGSGIAAVAGFTWMLLVQCYCGEKRTASTWGLYVVFLVAMVWLLQPDRIDVASLGTAQPFFWNAPGLLLQYLAFPFSAWGDARWIGFLMLLPAAHSVWCCYRGRAVLTDFVLIFFVFVAGTIALGRYRWMGLDADVSRYYVYIAPLWFIALLKLMELRQAMASVVVGLVVIGILIASLASAAALGNYANKMPMAAVVALNGNNKHLASLRRDAMGNLAANLENSREYLRAQEMDIYYQRRTHITPVDEVCTAKLLQTSVVSKGMFVDYILQENAENSVRIMRVYLTASDDAVVRYYGTAFAAVTHMPGWTVPLRSVRWSDWPLLLPVQWLPLSQRRLFVHLPRAVDPAALQWWGESADGRFCRLTVVR